MGGVVLEEAVAHHQIDDGRVVVQFDAAAGVVEEVHRVEGGVGDRAAALPDLHSPQGDAALDGHVANGQIADGDVAGADFQDAETAAQRPFGQRVVRQDSIRAGPGQRQCFGNDDVLVARPGVGSGGQMNGVAGGGLGHSVGDGQTRRGDVGAVAAVAAGGVYVAVAGGHDRHAAPQGEQQPQQTKESNTEQRITIRGSCHGSITSLTHEPNTTLVAPIRTGRPL